MRAKRHFRSIFPRYGESTLIKYAINPEYESTLKEFLLDIKEHFKKDDHTIHKARNEIKVIPYQGKKFVVKSFKKPSSLKALYYAKKPLKQNEATNTHSNSESSRQSLSAI